MPKDKAVSRQLRAINNDESIMKSAIEILDQQGWDEFTFANISRQAGLSSRPIRLRYSSIPQLVSDLYSKYLEKQFLEQIDLLHTAVYSQNGNRVERITEIVLDFCADSPKKRALIELIIVSTYEPEIIQLIEQNLQPRLVTWFENKARNKKTTEFALLLMLSLGLMAETRQSPLSEDELRNVIGSFVAHIQRVEREVTLPEIHAPHLDPIANIDTGDRALDELLIATLEELANFGLSKSTVVRIADRCNRTEGFIFSRYATKSDLLVDAVRNSFKNVIELNIKFQNKLLEKFTAEETLALTVREFMLPKHSTKRSLALEEIRLSWRNPELHTVYRGEQERVFLTLDSREDQAKLFVNASLNTGILLLAFLEPETSKLPYITRAAGLVEFLQQPSTVTK